MINYSPGNTTIHKLNGATKVFGFAVITVYIIMTFDVRVMIPMFLACLLGIISMKPNWKPIIAMFLFLTVTAGIIGSLMVLVVKPNSGLTHVGGETMLIRFSPRLYITKETLWYMGAMFFKRVCALSTSILFVLSITPSELAAGLNKLRMPYKVCTIISLAFRTIPDIARDYNDIKNSLSMRGVELDLKRVSIGKRLKQMTLLLVPLIMTSFGKVNNIANAMDLRGYGKLKERTWYSEHPPEKADRIARAILVCICLFVGYYIVVHRILYPLPVDYWCPWITF